MSKERSALGKRPWRIAVDTGGTFTDCLGYDPEGGFHRVKVLSKSCLRGRVGALLGPDSLVVERDWEAPEGFLLGFALWANGVVVGRVIGDGGARQEIRVEGPVGGLKKGMMVELQTGEEAPVLAARLLTGTAGGAKLPELEMRLGTTRGTNALLEGKGAEVALFVTKGFEDLPEIRDQRRPDLFGLKVDKRERLARWVIGVEGRLDAEGREIRAISLESAMAAGKEVLEAGGEVAAIALMHSYREAAHEKALEAGLLALGFKRVIRSSEICPFIQYLRRMETVVVDGMLRPIMDTYLDSVVRGLAGAQLSVMTSAGGLVGRALYRPVDSLLSGPAGGVVGAGNAAQRAGLDRVLAFDMGGTSTDVARWDGAMSYRGVHSVGKAEVMARAVKIETVAAGGGSICGYEGGRFFVGPESAGAEPGPACYGAGGPLTITDVNLLLGRLDVGAFQIPVDVSDAEARLDELMAGTEGLDRETVLSGFLRLANERMAQTMRQVSVREGYDPSDYRMVAYGGAGGMHACAVAGILGIDQVILPANAGLLSAEGLAHATVEEIRERQVLKGLSAWREESGEVIAEMLESAREQLAKVGLGAEELEGVKPTVELRVPGQESTLSIEWAERADRNFRERYVEVFGYMPPEIELEVVSVRVGMRTKATVVPKEAFEEREVVKPERDLRSWMGGEWVKAGIFKREDLEAGTVIEGPGLMTDAFSTIVVETGWRAVVGEAGTVRIDFVGQKEREESGSSTASVLQRELYFRRFENMVEEMGEQLRRTAMSPNIRERLDYSCALLDGDGLLLVNAPHIPVHLGALGKCARAVLEVIELGPGDVVVTNHPAFGGSHLPDITVLSGVFSEGGKRIGIVANRAHHAELGGASPGSMPPRASCLKEEGVIIEPRYLIWKGEEQFELMKKLLMSGTYPTRAVAENLADLRAQVAANRRGVSSMEGLVRQGGLERVEGYMAEWADLAEAAGRRRYEAIADGCYRAEDVMDDGSVIKVAVEVLGDRLTFDFSGTGLVHRGNLNATPAIVQSAVLYVLRLLVGEGLPLNEGLLRTVTIELPEGMLNPDFSGEVLPAVVGGNVETSQRIVDVLLTAFGLMANGQGTMNNVLFGNGAFGYYETIGGGAGAGPEFAGASGVHVHMSNTAITDAEVLEQRFPVRLERFGIRRGSGGNGANRGGDGLVREYQFLETVEVSLLLQRRRVRPRGAEGGEDGAAGRQRRILVNGERVEVEEIDGWKAEAGEGLEVETPGGGGWGSSKS